MRNHFDFFRFGVHILSVLIIISLGMGKAMAQEGEREYVPFVEEGKAWYCSTSIGLITPEHPEGNSIECIFTMCGDTLVKDREYKRVFCQYEEYYGDKEQHYYCAVREEAYQVFIVEDEATEEKLIYDFSCPQEYLTLTFLDYQFARTDGLPHYDFLPGQLEYTVCQFTDNGEVDYFNNPSSWVEGVGGPYNNPFAFEISFLPFGEPKFGKRVFVRTCMKDKKYIFNLDWMVEISGQEAIDEINHADNSQKGIHLYDLQGRRLNGQPTKGVYIQDGKKYVK